MDAATAALIGTGIGAAVTLAGTFGVSILQGRRERDVRKESAIAQLEMERRTEYVKLLTAARELRYVFMRKRQGQADRPAGEVDSLLTQLSAAYYMIALTAPEDTRRLAWDLRESIFELWRADHPESEQYRGHLRKARENSERFRSHVTTELKLTELGTSGIGTTSELPAEKTPCPLPGGVLIALRLMRRGGRSRRGLRVLSSADACRSCRRAVAIPAISPGRCVRARTVSRLPLADSILLEPPSVPVRGFAPFL
jgi:hypothetical protein